MKQFIQDFLVLLILSMIFTVIMFMWFVKEPIGYYKSTQTMQPNGTYYTWVENTK